MAESISVEWSSKDQTVIDTLQKMHAGLDRTIGKLDTLAAKSRKATDATASGFDEAIGKVVQFGKGLAGIGSASAAILAAANAIKNEYDQMMQRQQKALDTKVDVATAMRGTRLNFTKDETMESIELEPRIEGIAERTKMPVAAVSRISSKALSAKGDLTNKQAFDFQEAATLLSPDDEEGTGEVATRSMDVAKAFRVFDPKQVIGGILKLQSAARQSSTRQVGKTAVPMILAMQKTGDTFDEAGALFAAISNMTGDDTGEKTGTAGTKYATDAKNWVPKLKPYKDKEDRPFVVPKEQIDKYKAAKSTTERTLLFQQYKQLREAFKSENTFETGSDQAMQGMLSGSKEFKDAYGSAKATIGKFGADSAKAYDDKLVELGTGKYEPEKQATERGKSQTEQHALKSSTVRAQLKKMADEVLDTVNIYGLDGTARAAQRAKTIAKIENGVDPYQAYREELAGFRDQGLFVDPDKGFSFKGRKANEDEVSRFNEKTSAIDDYEAQNKRRLKRSEELDELRERRRLKAEAEANKPQKVEIINGPSKTQTPTTRPSASLGRR